MIARRDWIGFALCLALGAVVLTGAYEALADGRVVYGMVLTMIGGLVSTAGAAAALVP